MKNPVGHLDIGAGDRGVVDADATVYGLDSDR